MVKNDFTQGLAGAIFLMAFISFGIIMEEVINKAFNINIPELAVLAIVLSSIWFCYMQCIK
jgi:hypothetical protein